MRKTIKARKEHECCYCEDAIKKGEMHEFHRLRLPKYLDGDEEERQIGVEYFQYRNHLECPDGSYKKWQPEEDQTGSPCPYIEDESF